MPFPLAHPAAVLPLRRWYSKHLHFPALLIGAIVPDLSYCFGEHHDFDHFAHTLRGCFGFSLPVGWLITLVFFAIRVPLANELPKPHRQALLPASRRLTGAWYAVPLSVLIGALTHVFWDSFTHETGWFAERSSLLQQTLFVLDGHRFRTYRLLWHLSTWGGMLALFLAYRKTVQRHTGSARLFDSMERQRYALWAGILFLPFVAVLPFTVHNLREDSLGLSAIAHFMRASIAGYLVVVSVTLVTVGVILRVKRKACG